VWWDCALRGVSNAVLLLQRLLAAVAGGRTGTWDVDHDRMASAQVPS
jgi:hypothetical protein